MEDEVPQTKDRHALSCEAPARSGAFDRAVPIRGTNHALCALYYSAYLAQLKALQFQADIAVPLLAHAGRHTFATQTLEAGIPMESIAKMMGHASISSTQIYAQITDQKIARDMGRLIGKEFKTDV